MMRTTGHGTRESLTGKVLKKEKMKKEEKNC